MADPWTDGLALIFASQNPDKAAQMLKSGMLNGSAMQVGGTGQTDIGSMMEPASAQGAVPGAGPAPAAAAPPINPQMALAALQGIKAPAPITPIMHGGVTGGVTPPKATAGGAQAHSPVMQALLQALLGSHQLPAVPNLGPLPYK